MTVKCIATCFGYQDPGDDGVGAFGDRNDNPYIVGVSLPIPIIRESIGYDAWLVHAHSVMVHIGDKVVRARITDSGPGEKGELLWGRRTGLGHLLDLTKGTCDALGIRYDANNASYEAEFWILDKDGKPIEVKGLRGPCHFVDD